MVDALPPLEATREAARDVVGPHLDGGAVTNIIVLEYHDVVRESQFRSSGFDEPGADSYKMTCESFDAHLAAVSAASTNVGATVDVALADVGPSVPKRGARTLFTFDDGGVSAISEIAPRLESHGWVGHFFVTTDRIGTPGFLSEADIRDLHARGHVVGSHTCSHPVRMSACSPERLHREWHDSVARLSDILGTRVSTASVPGGYHSRVVAEAAASAGIMALFTSEPTTRVGHVAGCAELGRYTLRRDAPASMAAALVGRSRVARVRQWSLWNANKVLKALGGEAYLKVRALALGKR